MSSDVYISFIPLAHFSDTYETLFLYMFNFLETTKHGATCSGVYPSKDALPNMDGSLVCGSTLQHARIFVSILCKTLSHVYMFILILDVLCCVYVVMHKLGLHLV